MTETNALSTFLKGVLSKQKKERYLGFISNKKGQVKFLHDLDHSIEESIIESHKVAELTQQEWKESGYLFTSSGEFGKPVENLKTAYDSAPWEGGWLLINNSGSFGVLRPEGRIDDEIYIKL